MTIDSYEPCVCGSNKKVKFCCSKDITNELDKIIASINSDQRVAAMEQLNRLIESKGDRDCLLVTKASILIQLKQFEQAQELIDTLLERNPENALVLSQAAVLAMSNNDVDGAVVLLQNALDQIDDVMPSMFVEVMRMVGFGLLMDGRVQAARTHLVMFQQMAQKEDPEVMSMLMRTYGSTQLPLLLKEDHAITDAPEGVEWSETLKDILSLADRGRYRSAIERLRELEAQYPNEPVIRRNIAVLESRLGDIPAMVDAWRTYARTDNVDLDDAVEAEAMAQLLDDDPDREFVELVHVTFHLNDTSDAMEKMFSHPLFEYVQQDQARVRDDGSPPPKATYYMLSKPIPDDDAELTLEFVPEVTADIHLYGKQTDRDARLELILLRDEKFDERVAKLREELGDFVGDIEGEEVTERFTKQSTLLSWRWRLPPNTSEEVRDELAFQKHKEMLLTVWPDLPLDVLEGKTPREASALDEFRIPLLAAIMLMEETGDYRVTSRLDIDGLRAEMGLPRNEAIDPTERDMRLLSLPKFTRIDFEKLGDEELVLALRKATINGMPGAMQTILELLIGRESVPEEMFARAQAHAMLSRLVDDKQRALELIAKAQEIATEKGESPARFLLAEFELRLERGITDGTQQLLRRIDRDHVREPGIAQEMAQILARFGLLDPAAGGMPPGAGGGGMPGAGMPGAGMAGAGMPGAGMPGAEPGGGAPIQDAIWTPDGGDAPVASTPPPNPPAEDGPSKLWLPGMD